MSQLQNNTLELQNILETINNLPNNSSSSENLDEEISTLQTLIAEQDAKIAELAQVLVSKAGSSENNFKTAEITIQSSSRIISVVYTGIENMVPTARYSYVGEESVVITALQGTSIIVLTDDFITAYTSGAVRGLVRNNNNSTYIALPTIRCYHIPYNSGDAGLITING